MNDFVIERDPVTDKKVRRELTDGEQAVRDAPPDPAILEAKVQANADAVLQNDKKLRVMAELIFDTLKAGRTGNYSAFDGVTNKATFRDHVVARFRALK